MKLKNFTKKTLTIWFILILLLSLFFSTTVSAEFIPNDPNNPDGVAYDEFENANDITINDCSLDNGSIRLNQREFTKTFDKDETPKKIEGYKIASMILEFGNQSIFGFISQYFTPDILIENEFDTSEYNKIKNDDDDAVDTEAPLGIGAKPEWPINFFRFKTEYNKNIIDQFELTWRFGNFQQDANLEEISMWIWSYGTIINRWVYIGSLTYTQDKINETNGYLSFLRRDLDLISNDGTIDMLIVGKPKTDGTQAILYSDYVKTTITITEGYVPDGEVVSTFIEPGTLEGWERVIWSGSRPSKNSDVKIQILDKNDDVITDLEGNSDGFTYSPIDITSLNITKYKKIKLKALLHSENIEFSPRLNGWGVLWQTTDGFFDDFTYDFRINESYGVKIQGGQIKVSEFYSDWETFGKNPKNTRSYIGQETNIGINETYWYTSRESEYGGGFRSPVVKDGKVYIGSNEGRVYCFNLTTESTGDKHIPIKTSAPSINLSVDMALGVTDDYVIVATNRIGISNKIYALYRQNLSKKWEYSADEVNSICFSSSPTIANDRIFITSWSGKFPNNPMFSYLLNNLNNFFKSTFGIGLMVFNNKLIGLDINGGAIWNPISLPAASFSTPAVHNGIIYVGCENYEGKSFFAYDENTGEEIWNASIGLIGRSAPVVADGKVFVNSRQQSPYSFTGNDTIFAFDAETGEEIWNFSIGNNTNVIGNYLRIYGLDNRISAASPVCTPAYFNGLLFVMSQKGILYALDGTTGEEKWIFNAAEAIPGSDIVPYHVASPVVVDGIVYISTAKKTLLEDRAYIFALDITKNGEVKWEYEIIDPEFDPLVPQHHVVFASPVVTDGLVLISENSKAYGESGYKGRLQCIGNYSENTMGTVYSIPIHVQRGKWWNRFNATTILTNTSNTITFNILDENNVVLKRGLNGKNNTISDIKENVIKIYAELNIVDPNDPIPVLENWRITWNVEDKAPEFIENSFRAGEGQEGWINLLELPDCSIKAEDIGTSQVTSGLDVDTAQYLLTYVKKDAANTTSKWFDAVCNKDSGAKDVTITAKLSKDLEDIEIKELKNIKFKIADLAGNLNYSQNITFKIDSKKPSSTIIDADNYTDRYNQVEIEAQGTDDKSGVISISLYYRLLDSTKWMNYGSMESPYVWSFENKTSDEYEFCTIAKDKAGNVENFPSSGDISFLFDMNEPFKPDFENYYSFDSLPEFTITFADDYMLDSVEYKLSFHGLFEWIDIGKNINEKQYTASFMLSQNDWDRMLEDVLYTIFFRITDICGNVYETPTDLEALNIVKNEIPMSTSNVTLKLSNFEEGGWDDSFKITAVLPIDMEYEYISLKYSFSSDNNKFSKWEEYGEDLSTAPFEWDFKSKEENGYYKFKVTIYDKGEIVESYPISVNIAKFPTALIIAIIVLFLILFLFTLISIRKMKLKKK
jgi:outer membrane protein assembly factor BamB